MIQATLARLANMIITQDTVHVELNDKGQSYTDGRVIVLSLPPSIDVEDDQAAFKVYTSLLYHELGHVLFSDFSAFSNFYQQTPLKNHITTDQTQRLTYVLKSIANVIEDARVENLMANRYPQTSYHFRSLRLSTMACQSIKISEFDVYLLTLIAATFSLPLPKALPKVHKQVKPLIKAIKKKVAVLRTCACTQSAMNLLQSIVTKHEPALFFLASQVTQTDLKSDYEEFVNQARQPIEMDKIKDCSLSKASQHQLDTAIGQDLSKIKSAFKPQSPLIEKMLKCRDMNLKAIEHQYVSQNQIQVIDLVCEPLALPQYLKEPVRILKHQLQNLSQVSHLKGYHLQSRGKLKPSAAFKIKCNQTRVFESRPPTQSQVALSILIDFSASMGQGQLEKACELVACVESALASSFAVEIAGFTGLDCKVAHYLIKDFDCATKGLSRVWACYRGQLIKQESNVDEANINLAGLRLLNQPHKKKVLVVVSDGRPCNPNGIDGIKDTVKVLNQNGIEVVGLLLAACRASGGVNESIYPHQAWIDNQSMHQTFVDLLSRVMSK